MLALKFRSDMFAELFKAFMSEAIFPTARKQKLVMLSKPGSHPPIDPYAKAG